MNWIHIESETASIVLPLLGSADYQKCGDVRNETISDPEGDLEPNFFSVFVPSLNKGVICSYVRGKRTPDAWADEVGKNFYPSPKMFITLKYDPLLVDRQRIQFYVGQWFSKGMTVDAFNRIFQRQ